jgi:hypothetical protein
MVFPPRFYQAAALCSVLSAVTTLLLIFLPYFYAPGGTFELRMARVNDPAYAVRSWDYLIHPFLTMMAALGVAARLRRTAAGLVVPGLLCFLLWGVIEASQQALTLAAFDRWRHAYLAGDEAVRSTMVLRTALYDSAWDAMYFLLLIAFMIGNILYAAAMWRGSTLSRTLSVLYAAAALLTLTILAGELGGPSLPPLIEAWVYPLTQPLARVLIGVWLWRHADESLQLPRQ